MVLTRLQEIAKKEGFNIWNVKRHGKNVRVTSNTIMGRYTFHKKMKGAKTVNSWIKERFQACYPGFTCTVLNGDGKAAKGQTKLETVRDTY
jgi:hypothetical protein